MIEAAELAAPPKPILDENQLTTLPSSFIGLEKLKKVRLDKFEETPEVFTKMPWVEIEYPEHIF